MTNINSYTREVRNMAAAMYPHLSHDSNIDLDSILLTAKGAVNGIHELLDWLEQNPDATEDEIQFQAYECGKRNLPLNQLKQFFSCIYLMLMARPEGPRIGSTIKLIGPKIFVQQIRARMLNPFGWLNVSQNY